eukprot:TRINITY_DN41375_c0_g1_i1.p3 TRINITY_DN41375_c0_g1~~TRINITY_DN41375_c0_g1_i1.p3  ORF type:complete len:276 (+),score=104.68 TRINITY_DN41375_c0_g1_i1:52-828(+)
MADQTEWPSAPQLAGSLLLLAVSTPLVTWLVLAYARWWQRLLGGDEAKPLSLSGLLRAEQPWYDPVEADEGQRLRDQLRSRPEAGQDCRLWLRGLVRDPGSVPEPDCADGDADISDDDGKPPAPEGDVGITVCGVCLQLVRTNQPACAECGYDISAGMDWRARVRTEGLRVEITDPGLVYSMHAGLAGDLGVQDHWMAGRSARAGERGSVVPQRSVRMPNQGVVCAVLLDASSAVVCIDTDALCPEDAASSVYEEVGG